MIDYARYQRDYEKEQEEKGIWPYYSDLPLIKYCHAFGFPVHSHEYFRDVTKRWPYVLCEHTKRSIDRDPQCGNRFPLPRLGGAPIIRLYFRERF